MGASKAFARAPAAIPFRVRTRRTRWQHLFARGRNEKCAPVDAAAHVMLGFAHGRLIDCDKIEVGYVPLAEVGAEVPVPGGRGTGREGGSNRDQQPAVLGMDSGDSECPAVQGTDRPHYRSGAHHRDRRRILPLPQAPRQTQGPNLGGEHVIRAAIAGGWEKRRLVSRFRNKFSVPDGAPYLLGGLGPDKWSGVLVPAF